MSRVSSLGIHTPAALSYCITEKLLTDPPDPNSYTWTTGLPHEELLITGSAVIWTQGGVIRRVFRYNVENEPVIQALLTWFPSEAPQDINKKEIVSDDDCETAGYVSGGSDGNKRRPDWLTDDAQAKKRVAKGWSSKSKSYAKLGTPKSHPGNGKNETPKTPGATPSGTDHDDDEDPTSQPTGRARALVVFLKTQAFVYFTSGTMHVMHLPFEVEGAMAAPNGLVIQRKLPAPAPPPSVLNAYSLRPPPNMENTPRLFTCMDPLAELGLIMNTTNMPLSEDLLFISSASELAAMELDPSKPGKPNSPLPDVIFAVTHNKIHQHITIWQVRYIPEEPITTKRRVLSSGTASRRRSSFGPGTGGTNTPVAGGGPGAIPLKGKSGRESLVPSEAASFVSLDEDFNPSQRRSSRRVSSMVARADLSMSHDAGQRFSDMTGSLGASFSMPHAPPNSQAFEHPVDELLNELNMGDLGLGIDDFGAYDGSGLKQEMLMHRIESFPWTMKGDVTTGPNGSSRVFTIQAPSSVDAEAAAKRESGGRTFALFIINHHDNTMLELIFRIQLMSAERMGLARRTSTRYGGASSMGYTSVLLKTSKRNDVQDAIKLQDGPVQKVLILTEDNKFELYSPWGGNMSITLPPTLSRWNVNTMGEDGSRRGSRKKEFAKSLSTTPDIYQRLNYSETGGRVTVVDGDSVSHRICIKLAPRDTTVKACMETLRVVLGAYSGATIGEGIMMVWMSVSKWLLLTKDPESPFGMDGKVPSPVDEWKALVITLFMLAIPHLPEPRAQSRRKSAFGRSASMVAQREWEEMTSQDCDWGSGPEYLRNAAWAWMVEEEDHQIQKQMESPAKRNGRSSSTGGGDTRILNTFITDCIAHSRQFLKSSFASDVESEFYKKSDHPESIMKTALPVALVALHLLREEWKLDIAMEVHVRRFCPVLRQLAVWLGWEKWSEEYMLEDVEMVGWAYDETYTLSNDLPPEPFEPPDIYTWLTSYLKGEQPEPFMVLQEIITPKDTTPTASQSSQRSRNPFSPPPPPLPATTQKAVFAKLTPRTRIITSLYTILATRGMTEVDVVEKMVDLRMTVGSLQRLPEGIGIPIREAIAKCQEQPPTKWGVEALDIVGRKDLRMLIDPGRVSTVRGTKWQSTPTHEALRDVHSITASTWETEQLSTFDHMAEHDRQSVARLLFKDDRRLFEAQKLLQTNKPTMAKCIPEPQWSEAETLESFKEIATNAAMRTLACPPGRGLFNFSARVPLLTERFPISGFNLSCIMKPTNTTVSADKSAFTEEKVCWAFFHSGVAAGVSISRDAAEIDTSWIVFNKPTELTNRHAGFLLGLGLNGHLKNIAKWHAFNYLTPKHTMTSIGLLLGMSASYLGTMDTVVTKLLSVHVTRLLPPGSAELNLSNLTQTAGVMGIGLLYANTQHRRMSEIMLSEMEYVEPQESNVPSDTLRDEGYRLAAGFALGLINLGCGSDIRGMHDMHLVERLLHLSVGPKKVSIVHILDRATAGATIALALIYVKTNDEALARKLDVPETQHLLDNVRPDIFLLRTIAANLIMWDRIRGSFEWIYERLRPFHRGNYKLTKIHALDSDDLPLFNIIAGLGMAIGLKYAGSHHEGVREVLLHYLDQFIRLGNLPAVNHDQILTRNTVRNCISTLALSSATIMSGTGDIPVFRRLRKLHARLDSDLPYGSHLSSHLAIGVLFLGNGAFTFGTSNLAIASLLASFYPLWPDSPLDNRAHLQALRHFWVLAVENRCIVPRDVDTFRPTSIPITITLKSGEEITKLAPTLLPDLNTIQTITTTSPMYWTVTLDLANSPAHMAAFKRAQSLYVARRSAHASQSTVFQATLQALEEIEENKGALEWLVGLSAFDGLERSEKALLVGGGEGRGDGSMGLQPLGECVDERMELERGLKWGRERGRLRSVAMVCVAGMQERGVHMGMGAGSVVQGGIWLGEEVREGLRARVWVGGLKGEYGQEEEL